MSQTVTVITRLGNPSKSPHFLWKSAKSPHLCCSNPWPTMAHHPHLPVPRPRILQDGGPWGWNHLKQWTSYPTKIMEYMTYINNFLCYLYLFIYLFKLYQIDILYIFIYPKWYFLSDILMKCAYIYTHLYVMYVYIKIYLNLYSHL